MQVSGVVLAMTLVPRVIAIAHVAIQFLIVQLDVAIFSRSVPTGWDEYGAPAEARARSGRRVLVLDRNKDILTHVAGMARIVEDFEVEFALTAMRLPARAPKLPLVLLDVVPPSIDYSDAPRCSSAGPLCVLERLD